MSALNVPDGEWICREQVVKPEWIDYSGHMNIGYYLLAFELAAQDFFRLLLQIQ